MNNIGIAINPSKDKKNNILNMVIKKFKGKFDLNNIVVFNSVEIEKQNLKGLDLLVVLGGDGTLLGIARALKDEVDIPLFGVNIGNLGFLSSVEISELDEALDKIKDGNYRITERMKLSCSVDYNGGSVQRNALNDVVLARGTLSRMVKVKVFVDGKI